MYQGYASTIDPRQTESRRSGEWDRELEEKSFQRWKAAMSSGDFAQAWEINLRCNRHWPSLYSLFQDGLTSCGELTVYGLSGLADIVQMLGYAERLRTVAERVTYVVPSELEPLMKHFVAVEHVRPLPASTSVFPVSMGAEVMELPFIFRTVQSELPVATNYLDRTGELRERFARRTTRSTKKLRIGLAWEGSTWDTDRWIPTQELAPLFELENVEFQRLQGSVGGRDLPFQDDDEIEDGIVGTVSMMANLDLVLTIDGLSAHLAGALGVPTWIMLKHDADWRWLTSGHQSLWYPTARLFRQPQPGNWKRVIAEVVPMLDTLAAKGKADS